MARNVRMSGKDLIDTVWEEGYVTATLYGHSVYHVQPGRPYSGPLCGSKRDSLMREPQEDFEYTVCGNCLKEFRSTKEV